MFVLFGMMTYLILCLIVLAIDGIIATTLDSLGLYSLASIASFIGLILPVYVILPLFKPGIFQAALPPAVLYVLLSYGILRSIMWVIWFWTMRVSSTTRELESLRLKLVGINAFIAAGASFAIAPFSYRELLALALSLGIGIFMSIIGIERMRAYKYRRRLLKRLFYSLKGRPVVKLEDLVVQLKLPDHVIRDLLYELWHMDVIDLVEIGGTSYVYLRPAALKL